MLFAASKIYKILAAIQTELLYGIMNKQRLQKIAPIKKYGVLLPHFVTVLSLKAPTIG